MRFRPSVLLFLSVVVLIPFTAWSEADSPHLSPDGCVACHIAIPSPEDAARETFFLIRETIDETCKTCHEGSGCEIGVNRTAHPSGLEIWESRTGTGPHPHALPLHGGKIACTTCHYRTQQEDNGYRRVRMAVWSDGRPDLSSFCADCHGNYF